MSRIYKSNQLKEKETKVITNKFKAAPTSNNKQKNIKLSESEEVANQIIEEAKNEATRLLEAAKAESIKLLNIEKEKISEWWNKKREEDSSLIAEAKAQGYQEGYDEGYLKAEEAIKLRYQEYIEQAQGIIKEAFELKEQIIQESEEKIIELCIVIAEKILYKELELNPEIIKDMTKNILINIKEFEKISIYVSPDNLQYLQSAREELVVELNGQVELMIFPDPTIKSGGCMIKTSYGTLDAKLDTQLEEVKKILLETFLGNKDEQ